MSSIHYQRAKRWGTNPWIAEWLANGFEYCHNNAEGKRAFESWVMEEYGPIEGPIKLRECKAPAAKKHGKPSGNALLWNASGVEFGVCDEAMILYHRFTSRDQRCHPERTKPAPRRRRGESSAEWLARRHEALLTGAKLPNFEWQITRAIALSEFDRTRDTIEVWRRQPEIFFHGVMRRSESTIMDSELDHEPEAVKAIQRVDFAFKSRTKGINYAYMAWSSAAALFEDLARMGLTTPSALERAYKKDTKLFWRMVSCFAKVETHFQELWGKLAQVISHSEYFRPYFKRTRVRGVAKIESNKEYIKQHPLKSHFDQFIIQSIDVAGTGSGPFFDNLTQRLAEDPSSISKFSAEAMDEIGDIAAVSELITQIWESPFGERLDKHIKAMDALGPTPELLSEVGFMDPARLPSTPRRINTRFGETGKLVQAVEESWSKITWQVSMVKLIQIFWAIKNSGNENLRFEFISHFDQMWYEADLMLWNGAKQLDKPSSRGRVAQEFGLVDPTNPNRPTFSEFLFKSIQSQKLTVASTPAPAPSSYIEALSVARPTDSAAQSGHSHVAETKQNRSQSKKKTKGASVPVEASQEPERPEEDLPRLETFPVALPNQYKLAKKLIKVFRRLLDDESKGQLRWGDFEKAMRRVGFDVVQTAGSSVRFDPPAQTVRPITFHRPHPDSIMEPHLIKWVGARLKRTYAWSIGTFIQQEGLGDFSTCP